MSHGNLGCPRNGKRRKPVLACRAWKKTTVVRKDGGKVPGLMRQPGYRPERS